MSAVWLILGAAFVWWLVAPPQCPVCRGPHYREPGEQHAFDCYLGRHP